MNELLIRPATDDDFANIWPIFHAIIAAGETYAFDPATTPEQARAAWMPAGGRVFVAERDGRVVGTYLLKPNQTGLGSHVANASFLVDPASEARGVGRAMGRHCLRTARERGFRAMQFNLVVSTNTRAIGLWESLGFRILATLPGAFQHRRLGFVDAHVMFRSLLDLRSDPSCPSAPIFPSKESPR